jgi:hypothetical protein
MGACYMRRSARPLEDAREGKLSVPKLQVGRIAGGSWIAALMLIAAVALTQAAGVQAEGPRASGNACASTPGVKPLIRGLVDRGPVDGGTVPPAAGLQASSINVDWSTLEPTRGALVPTDDDPIWAATQAAGCTPIRIRVLAGIATPDWVVADSGAVSVINPYGDSNTPETAGQFWTPAYEADYDQFEQLLADRYELVPNVVEFVVSRCALFYPEPFLLGTSNSQNDVNLLAAGYTVAADQQCEQEEIDTANADWPTTRIGVSFNPYQTLVAATNSKGYTVGTDEAYTEQMMAYCRYALGQRCVLENDSIRDPISSVGNGQPFYNEMYAEMTGASGPVDLTLNGMDVEVPLGAPIAFQTATAGPSNAIGDLWATLEWAAQQHAASVELPLDGTYPTTGGAGTPAWQTLPEVSQWFQGTPTFIGNAVNATQGSSTAADAVGTVTLNELAGYDTQLPYGDVGSVPFDTVSAMITWPNGVVQPGLVFVGSGTPTPSATCDTATCTVTVFSGGYTFPELPVSGAGSVAITLADNGAAYTPADGVNIAGTFPVTVTPAPLTLKTLTVTPAKSAPTVKLAATFADADPLGVAGDYTIKVTWGDGTSSTIAATASSKGFSVSASHRYKRAGKDTLTITITDTGGATVSGSRTITVR